MTKDRLQSLPYSALKELAKREGITNYEDLPIGKFIETVVETLEEKKNDRIIANNVIIRGEEKKYDIFRDEEIEPYEDIYGIPETYNTTKVQLILVEPFLAYAYWDFSEKDDLNYLNNAKEDSLFLRVYEKSITKEDNSDKLKSKLSETGGKNKKTELPDFFDIPVNISDEFWYINLPSNNKNYYCELIMIADNGENILCKSNTITSPAKTFKDLETLGNFIDEDILLLSGFYKFDGDENISENPIPQRIISFVDDKYLNEL